MAVVECGGLRSLQFLIWGCAVPLPESGVSWLDAVGVLLAHAEVLAVSRSSTGRAVAAAFMLDSATLVMSSLAQTKVAKRAMQLGAQVALQDINAVRPKKGVGARVVCHCPLAGSLCF
jgi:hypothetical protein